MVIELSRVNIAYRGFSTRKGLASLQPQLAAAEQTMRELRRRLARLQPPPLAAPIHRDLLRLFAADAGVAHELAGISRFLPAFERARAPAVTAGRRMRTGLERARTPAAQARVLDRYAAASAAAVRRLRRLRPPAVLAPTYRSELETVDTAASLASRLAAALRAGDRVRLPGLNARFQALAGGAIALSGANAEALAIRAYARRLQAIAALQARIERERLKLQHRIG